MSKNLGTSPKPCRAPFDGMVVHFSGAVFPCDQLSQNHLQKNMQIGNINDTSLRDIFWGDKIQEIRRGLFEGQTKGLLCYNCNKSHTCNLYGDPNSGEEGGLLHGGAELDVSYNNPKISRLELAITDLCNMKCTMCSLSRGEASPSYTPKNGFMELETIKNIIDETVEISTSQSILLTLHWIGEPLIHPEIIEILQHISQYPILNLHLVTNGIALRPKIVDVLMKMKGTLNVSLNARTPTTFAIVNQSSRYDEVHNNIFHFLERRRQSNKQSDWAVIVSSVVLAENYQEIPEFIRFWENTFESLGEKPSISLNGKGEQSPTQIMILQEIELPKSDVYFRQSLRQSEGIFPEIDLERYQHYDHILLHHDSTASNLDFESIHKIPPEERSLLAVKLVTYLGFVDDIIPFVNLDDFDTRAFLEHLLRQKNIDVSKIPLSFQTNLERYWTPLLLCLAFPNDCPRYLRTLTIEHLCSHADSLDVLGEIIRRNRHLQNYISIKSREVDECTFFDIEEREILALFIGEGHQITSLSEHRIEWLCGILSEIDSPDIHFSIRFSVQSIWSFYLALFDSDIDRNKNSLTFDFSTETFPDWIIRAVRRRVLFGRLQLKPMDFKKRVLFLSEEVQLLNILLAKDISALEVFLFLQMKNRHNAPQRWFDILEVQHHIGLSFSSDIQKTILYFSKCPLLVNSSQSKLALYLMAHVDMNTFHDFFQSSTSGLTNWQIQLGNSYIRNNV